MDNPLLIPALSFDLTWLGVEWTPDPEKSGNRCAKPDPRYSTRLSAKVLILRITVYFIKTVPFSLWAQSSWYRSSENCKPINWLATTRHFTLNKAENIENFFQPASDKPDPYPVLTTAYVPDTRPDTDFLCSFHPQTWHNPIKHP